MAKVKVLYDQTGNTLTVWFDDPHDEYICEETGDEPDRVRIAYLHGDGDGSNVNYTRHRFRLFGTHKSGGGVSDTLEMVRDAYPTTTTTTATSTR